MFLAVLWLLESCKYSFPALLCITFTQIYIVFPNTVSQETACLVLLGTLTLKLYAPQQLHSIRKENGANIDKSGPLKQFHV